MPACPPSRSRPTAPRTAAAAALAAAALVACVTTPGAPPPPDRTLAAGAPAEAFACGMRLVNELGYVVAAADREAGFLRAERDHTGLGQALLEGIAALDQLTLTVYPREDGRTVLRVVLAGIQQRERGDHAGARSGGPTSRRAPEDVQRILAACGTPLPPPVPAAAG